MSQELREAINAIFTEYDKPSTTKTYPGQKSRVRRGAAIDQLLALFQKEQLQLAIELLEQILYLQSNNDPVQFRRIVKAQLEHKKQELERGK